MLSIKKYFPLQLFVAIALFVIGALYIGDDNYPSAKKSKIAKRKSQHYETMLLKSPLVTETGKKFTKKELTSGLVILNFWATWCTPCLEEFPSVVALRKKFPSKNLKIIAINSDDDSMAKINVKKVKKKYSLNFDIVMDPKGKLTDEYMISSIPVSIIYHNGKVIEVSNGAKDFASEEFYETVEKLIK